MPTATIELPRDMLDAASSYAERGRMSVVEFFADMMKRQYGYQMHIVIENPRRVTKGMTEENPLSEFVGCIGGSRRTDDVVSEMRGYDQW